MRKNLYLIMVAFLATTFMASCGGEENGLTEEVLSEKVYGKVITNYDDVSSICSEGTCVVVKDNKYGVIDTKGNEIIPCQYKEIFDCSEGLFLYKHKEEDTYGYTYGFLDMNGDVAIKAVYDDAGVFSDGLAPVANDKSEYAFINKKGEVVVDYGTYYEIEAFSNGLAAVKVKNDNKSLWGYIDTKGEMAIAANYEYVYPFSDDVAIVGKNDKEFVIDTKGEVVYVVGEDVALMEEVFSEGFMPFAKETGLDVKFGFINNKGEIAIPAEYDYIEEGFIDGEALALKGNKQLIINTNGKVVEEIELDEDELEELLEEIEYELRWAF